MFDPVIVRAEMRKVSSEKSGPAREAALPDAVPPEPVGPAVDRDPRQPTIERFYMPSQTPGRSPTTPVSPATPATAFSPRSADAPGSSAPVLSGTEMDWRFLHADNAALNSTLKSIAATLQSSSAATNKVLGQASGELSKMFSVLIDLREVWNKLAVELKEAACDSNGDRVRRVHSGPS